MIKALSLWQPWASLMAVGLKTIETRGWATRYRGPLAIHAAKRPMSGQEKGLLYIWACKGLCPADWLDGPSLPYGAILVVVELVDCRPTEKIELELLDSNKTELEFGNYAPGRWAWITRNPRPLVQPVFWRGAQGLFEVPDSALTFESLPAAGGGALREGKA